MEEYGIADIQDDFTESSLIAGERNRYTYASYVEKFGIEELERMAGSEPSVLLSTIHRVKGGEADFVAVFLASTRNVEKGMRDDLNAELRVLYTGCTRARIGLYVMGGRSEYSYDNVINVAKEMAT
jgi:superfamily I DNA/RNA helicase